MENKIKERLQQKAKALWGDRWLQELAETIDHDNGRKPGASTAALYGWFGNRRTITVKKLSEIMEVVGVEFQ